MLQEKNSTMPAKKQVRTARISQLNLRLLTEEDIACIEGAQERLDNALMDIVNRESLTKKEFSESFYPYISSPSVLSKIIAHSGADKRHVSLELAFALRRVYGIDLNAIADGDAQPRPDLPEYVKAAIRRYAAEFNH